MSSALTPAQRHAAILAPAPFVILFLLASSYTVAVVAVQLCQHLNTSTALFGTAMNILVAIYAKMTSYKQLGGVLYVLRQRALQPPSASTIFVVHYRLYDRLCRMAPSYVYAAQPLQHLRRVVWCR